jgi:hypothetical protein
LKFKAGRRGQTGCETAIAVANGIDSRQNRRGSAEKELAGEFGARIAKRRPEKFKCAFAMRGKK